MKSGSVKIKDSLLGSGLFLLLLLPTLYHVWWYREDVWPFLITGVVVCTTMTAITMCLPWRTGRWLFFSVLFAVSLFEFAHLMVYDGDISSAGYVRSLFMTTPYEAEGALGRVIRQHMGFIVFLVVAYIVLAVQIFITKPAPSAYRWILPGVGVLLLIHLWVSPSALFNRPPLNIYAQMAEAWRQRGERNRLTMQEPDSTYHAYREQTPANKELYLLIMDESLRYDHVSLDGTNYRITMPRMGRLDQMVSYTDYYTTAVFTMYAVPMLITRATPATFVLNYKEWGVQQAFVEAGFKSVWLSNEAQLVSDGVSDYVARGAEVIRVKHDMDMPAVVDSLCGTADKLFVVLHLWGNHQFYLNTDVSTSLYYPDITTTDDVHGEQMYNNAYDNAILYTDSMLLALTEVLQTQSCIAQWLFTSDHGEGPIGRNGGAHGYTHPSSGEYHVPLMVWYSDEYKTAYPEKVANMLRHKDEPVCADHVFWSVLDMADIQIDSALQQKGMSIFGDTLLPHPRVLLLPDGKNTELVEEIYGNRHQ